MPNSSPALLNISQYIDGHPVGRLQRIVFALCFMLIALEGFDTAIVSFIAPQILHDGIIGQRHMALLIGVGMVGLLIGAPIGGILADRFGRKKVLAVAVCWFALCCIISPLISQSELFIFLRFLAGLGIGAAMPPVANMVAEHCPTRYRTSMLAFVFCGFIFGAMAAGICTGMLSAHIGWRGLLFIGGISPLVVILAFILLAEESVMFIVVAGRAREQIAAIMRRLYPTQDFASNNFIAGEDPPASKPLNELFSPRYRIGSLLIWSIQLLAYYVFYQLSNWLPSYLVGSGYQPAQAARMASFFQLGSLLGSLCCVWMTRRHHGAAVAAVSYVLGVTAIAALALGQSSAWFPVTIFFSGLFVGGPIICVNALATVYYPTSLRGLGSGVAVSCGRLGSIAGAFIVGAAIQAGFSYPQIFSSSSLVLLAAVIMLATLYRLLRKSGQPELSTSTC